MDLRLEHFGAMIFYDLNVAYNRTSRLIELVAVELLVIDTSRAVLPSSVAKQ